MSVVAPAIKALVTGSMVSVTDPKSSTTVGVEPPISLSKLRSILNAVSKEYVVAELSGDSHAPPGFAQFVSNLQ